MPADSPSPWRLRRRARLPQGEIAVDTFGSGPPVVLVHGTPSWSYLWRHVAPALADRFTVHVFDLFGYGDSPADADADVSIPVHAEMLVELLRRWDLESPAIAGHDIGAAVVLRAHLLHGVPFRRVALVDAVALAPWVTPTTRHVQAHPDAYATMPNHIFEEIVKTHLRTAVHRPLDEEALEAYLAPWKGEQGQAAYLRKVAHFDDEHTRAFEPRLGTISVPVHVVWGAQDAWLSPDVARRLRDRIPGAELTLVPGAGHFAMEDAPDEVARTLRSFFAGG
jgi:pimeloyl-ACP methyl ester carboxylesterase